jgi:nitrogen fixation protein NifZ
MQPQFDYGDSVRLVRNIRNDGTYPGMDIGQLIIKRGAVGCVYDVGTYLQDQLIYKVHFLNDARTVGCREEELIAADAHWIQNLFEFRDKVVAKKTLAANNEIIAEHGDCGEVQQIIRESDQIKYHVRFNGRLFLIPESSLSHHEEDISYDQQSHF